jgi:DNA-binding NarL/FixJ family response regulator
VFLSEIEAFLRTDTKPAPAIVANLSARELDVLEFVSQGLTNEATPAACA